MKSYIVKERADGTRYFDENTPAGNITPEIAGDGLTFSGGKLNVDGTDLVHKTGAEALDGKKTFLVSPLVPTPELGDSSDAVPNTSWVRQSMGAGLVYNPVSKQIDTQVKVATGDITFYVRKNGSDSNDGLTEDTALLTISEAIKRVCSYHYIEPISPALTWATINVGAGTWTERVWFPYILPLKRIRLEGQGDTTIFDNANGFAVFGGLYVVLRNVLIKVYQGGGVTAGINSYLSMEYVSIQTVGTIGAVCLVARAGACVAVGTGCKISGTATSALMAHNSGVIEMRGNVSINGTFTNGTVRINDNGSFFKDSAVPTTLSGTVVGKRYIGERCASINTNGSGANFFPGSIAGTVDSTSSYA